MSNEFYDYTNQAWVVNGHYIKCGHPDSMDCDCYGKLHAGEKCTEETYLETHPIKERPAKVFEIRGVNTCNCLELSVTTTRREANEIAEGRRSWGHTSITIEEVEND